MVHATSVASGERHSPDGPPGAEMKPMEKVIRVFDSFEDADASDTAFRSRFAGTREFASTLGCPNVPYLTH